MARWTTHLTRSEWFRLAGLGGAALFLQGLELDAGASRGISFSAGLEILVGR